MNRLRVVLVGPVPPPAGGVAMHLIRLKSILVARGMEVMVVNESRANDTNSVNIRRFQLVQYVTVIAGSDVVYIHSGVPLFRILHILLSKLFRKKVVLTLHSYRASAVLAGVEIFFFRLCNTVVCVNESIKCNLMLRNAVVKDAFLPPSDDARLPNEIGKRLESDRLNGVKIIVSNASRLILNDGEDLYGADICIEACRILKESGLNFCFYFVVCDPDNSTELEKAKKLLGRLELDDCFKFILGSLNFSSLLKESDVSVRATNTDGDSISVRESLCFGVPIVASDVVGRPMGVTLFTNRDAKSLAAGIVASLSNEKSSNSSLCIASDVLEEFYVNLVKQ